MRNIGGQMSNETQFTGALKAASGPLCDDCVTKAVEWNNRQQANSVGSKLAGKDAISRAKGICARCGVRKIVNALPRGTTGGEASPHVASASEAQRARIITLLGEGQLDREEIASEVGVSPGVVSAIKAHISMGTYGGLGTSDAATDELIGASEVAFGLERDLHIALPSDIERLEPGLRILDEGRGRTTDAGQIEITASDADGATVVIELKAGTAAPEALTQLLAYMGAIGGEEQAAVRGILIAGDFHPRIVHAAKAIPNVQLSRYRFRFTFEAVE